MMHLQDPCIDEARLYYMDFGSIQRRQTNYSNLIYKEIPEDHLTCTLSELSSKAAIRYFALEVDVIYEDDD